VLRLTLAKTDNRKGVRNDKVSEDESDEDFTPDEPMSEIEDNVDLIAKSSTDDEKYRPNNGESEAVQDYWSSAVNCAKSWFAGSIRTKHRG